MRIVFDLFCALLGRGRFAVCATATAGALLVLGAAPALADSCPNAQFRTGPSAGLPDCRAYEWVTPTLDGAVVEPGPAFFGPVIPSGDGVAFQVNDAPAGAKSSPVAGVVVATRSASGWQDSSLEAAPTESEQGFESVKGIFTVSSDLSEAVVESDQPLVAGAQPGENLYLRHADGSYALITDAATDSVPIPGFTVLSGLPSLEGVSADFSHVFFTASVAQLPQDPLTGGGNLYQWADGQLSIVNVLPDGSLGTQSAGFDGASADGDSVLFDEAGSLYLRIDDDQTIEVGDSQRTTPDPNGAQTPSAVGITPDGSNVLFLSHSELTDDANTGSSDFGQDLYEYDLSTGALSDLTPDSNPADANGADVQQVVGESSDWSYVYFVATGDLAAGGVSGQQNLYVEHDGAVSFVADFSGRVGFNEFYVTPSGQDAAFVSTGDLTGYDDTDASSGQADGEVYEYDAPTGRLTCASCRPDGTRPTGSAGLPDIQSQVVSDDGQRVFFQSTDQVIPAASNDLQNVYEWEADGDGSCTQAGGCVFLISPGSDGSPVDLLGSSASGDDVFFSGFDNLAPQDQTHQSALFDARVGGGFPVPPAAPTCGDSETCQGAAPGAPASQGAGSVGFSGPGDAVPAAVAKSKLTTGKVRVTHKSVKGAVVTLTVKAPGKGRVTVTGAKFRRAVRVVSRAGSYRVTVGLTKQAAQSWHRDIRLVKAKDRHTKARDRLTLKVAYRPASGRASAETVSVELKG